jgi:hypothetical protein
VTSKPFYILLMDDGDDANADEEEDASQADDGLTQTLEN